MRMAPNCPNLVCKNCLERKFMQGSDEKEASEETKNLRETKEYFCTKCKYSFKRAKHIVVDTCPYCDTPSVVRKGSASKILSDASKMKGD